MVNPTDKREIADAILQALEMPEEERKLVFDRFSRGSTASHSGSGLGLALVAQQAELHGGTASLEDSPLGGVRLLLRLLRSLKRLRHHLLQGCISHMFNNLIEVCLLFCVFNGIHA